MSKPNITVIYGGGTVGGAEEYLYSLMKKIDLNKFGKVIFLSLGDAPLVERVKGLSVEVKVVKYSHFSPLKVLAELKQIAKEEQITLINTHGLRSNTFGRILGSITKIPVVTTVHSVLKYDYPTPLKRKVAQTLESLTRPITKRFIAVSEAVGIDLVEQGVPKEKITVVHNGIDLSRFKSLTDSAKKEIASKLGINPGNKVIGIIGRLQPVKGHKYFLEAARVVANKYPSIKFVVVGDGPLRSELENQAKALGIENKVIFTGFRSDINDLLGVMDIFCLSSLMEGLPLAPLEAMALKKPVVATAVGGVTEIIKTEAVGLLAPPANPEALADKLLQLLDKEELANSMAEEGHHLVRASFNFEKMVTKVETVYLEMAKNFSPKE